MKEMLKLWCNYPQDSRCIDVMRYNQIKNNEETI